MKIFDRSGKVIDTYRGFPICPQCGGVMRGIRIRPDTSARNLQCFCKKCKIEHIINIVAVE